MADRNGFCVVTTVQEERYFVKEHIHYPHCFITRSSGEEASACDEYFEYGPFSSEKIAMEEAERMFKQKGHKMIDCCIRGLDYLLNQSHTPTRDCVYGPAVEMVLPRFSYTLFVEKKVIDGKKVEKNDEKKVKE